MGVTMSLKKLAAGSGYEYLTRQVAAADSTELGSMPLADYYAAKGEAPGRWIGSGLAGIDGLGYGDVVTDQQMKYLFGDGCDPVTGAALGRALRPGSVAGFDLTFSPAKSISALWAVAPPEVAQRIRQAHNAAVLDALAFLESHAIFTREGTGGARQVETRGLIAAAFLHRDSRAGDPDLHTHVAVANKVQRHRDPGDHSGRQRTRLAPRHIPTADDRPGPSSVSRTSLLVKGRRGRVRVHPKTARDIPRQSGPTGANRCQPALEVPSSLSHESNPCGRSWGATQHRAEDPRGRGEAAADSAASTTATRGEACVPLGLKGDRLQKRGCSGTRHSSSARADANGVSTRKVDDLAAALGVDTGISKTAVSRMCAGLDEQAAAYDTGPLDHCAFPYVFLRCELLQGPPPRPCGLASRRDSRRSQSRWAA